jgi:glycosyltransferase involved in cell wall biosynthesis
VTWHAIRLRFSVEIYYFSQYDGLRPTTNPLADARLCRGLHKAGARVTLVLPYVFRRSNLPSYRVREVYGLDVGIRLRRMPGPLVEGLPSVIAVPILMACVLAAYLLVIVRSGGRLTDVAVISRDANSLAPVLLLNHLLGSRRRSTVLHWAHELRLDRPRYRRVYRQVDGMLATNGSILRDLAVAGPDYVKPSAVTYNCVPARYLDPTPNRLEARRELGLPAAADIVVHTGKLGFGLTEIEHILAAAQLLWGVTFILTGGKSSVVRHFRTRCAPAGMSNMVFTGFMHDPRRVRLYQRAADVLVSYYTPQDHAVEHNLPQKVFEYMASGAVIVSPAYPATADVLTTENSLIVPPEDPDVLAEGIAAALRDRQRSEQLAAQALRDARRFTIEVRGPVILGLIEELGRQRVDSAA